MLFTIYIYVSVYLYFNKSRYAFIYLSLISCSKISRKKAWLNIKRLSHLDPSLTLILESVLIYDGEAAVPWRSECSNI